jgi:catechol 2,3-dioxygenase-like lactoylglutathione lyase family enzyme
VLESKELQNVYPTLCITDYEKSKAFYVDGLGFQNESEPSWLADSLRRETSLMVSRNDIMN